MARLNAANFAESTLSAQVLDNALEFPVQTGHGVRYPTPPFRVVIYTGANKEIVEITSVSTDSLICDNINKRALEGTSAIQHESGSVIENAFTAGAHEELADDDHVHGGLSNDGKIGTSANIPIITGTDGVLQAGSFGTAANTFCEGDDGRLSDARTPSNHNLIDTTGHPVSGLTTGHFLKATGATTYAFGAHGLSYTDVGAAATSHAHGDITNDGKIGTTEDLVIVTGASGVLTAKTAGTSAQFLRGDGSWAEPASGGLTDENKVQIRMFGKVI